MSHVVKWSGLLLGGTFLMGCQFYARAPEDYAKETEALLSTKSDEIKSCYDNVLKDDKKAEGVVFVNFKVESKTGKIKEPMVDDEKTTAPKELSACVVQAIDGLTLDPPDQREGVASFEYEFKANAPKQL